MKGNDAYPFQDYVQATYSIAKYTSHINQGPWVTNIKLHQGP